MLSYSSCRRDDISLKSRPFFTGMGVLRCLSDLITVRQTARSPLCATGIHSC
ncbi:heat-shock protein [Salmonella enterica subsp. enterica serovar Enteritidis]|nr:heat-shock protein [Salmonella enterica subsp. enterica serovar Enteritidis]ATT34404.1 heat-shock protein [Salmonella enterica subsp. enterica serovar Enteritidis]